MHPVALRRLYPLPWSFGVAAMLCLGGSVGSVPLTAAGSGSAAVPSTPSTAEEGRPVAGYGDLPLSFEAASDASGEPTASAAFLARGRGYALSVSGEGAVLALTEKRSLDDPPGTSTHHVQMRLIGGRPVFAGRGERLLPGKVHYLRGNDPTKWRTNVPTYGAVRFEDVYPGIDVVYYGHQGELEYDFVVTPGTNPAAIRLGFEGVASISLDEAGDLLLSTPAGVLRQHKPVLYQDVDGQRRLVDGRYVVDAQRVRIDVGTYDTSRALVIDPVLVYSGGVGGAAAQAVAVDSTGQAYVAGYTHPPINDGEAGLHGGRDGFVRKINAAGTAVLWTSFIGGSADDWAYGVAVDDVGAAYVTGATRSTDFPTLNAFDATYGGPVGTTSSGDAFVVKLSADGATFAYATYLGGAGDDHGRGIAVRNGNAYVVGETSLDFPTTAGAFQAIKPAAGYKAFVTQLSSTGAVLVYSTYLGSTRVQNYSDWGKAIAVDTAGNAYVTGYTGNNDFPTVNPAQTWSTPTTFTADGRHWAFVSKLNPAGSALVYSTYLGGGLGLGGPQDNYNGTEGAAIAIDAAGQAYVTGNTRDVNFPRTAGAFDTTCAAPAGTIQGCQEAFVTKISADGKTFLYSSYLGGTNSGARFEGGLGIAVDAVGRAYVVGATGTSDFPMASPYQSTTDTLDAFVSVVNAQGTSLEFSTYLGGTGAGDAANGVAVDANRNAYVVGYTVSASFPSAGGLPNPAGGNVSSAGGFITKFSAIGCTYGVTPSTAISAPAASSTGQLALTSTAGCGWATSANVSWLTLTPAGGDGAATVTYTVAPNSSTNPRTGTMTIANTTIVVQQAGLAPGACTYGVFPTSLAPPAVGETANIGVTTTASCAWEVTSTVPWVTVSGNRSGSGNASYTVTPNLTASARTGNLFIAGQTVVVTQAAGPATNCPGDTDCDGLPTTWETQFGLNPGSAAGTDGSDADPDGDGRTNAQELAAGTHPRGFYTRYLAEGATSTFFDTRLALANPTTTAAITQLRFLRVGAAPISHLVTVGATARATVTPKAIAGLATAEFSTVVESDQLLIVDRTIVWDGDGYGAHAETAVAAPSTTWYLAEGSTVGGFNLFYLLQNPNTAEALVRVRYLRPSGLPLEKTYTLPANSRTNIWVNEEVFTGLGKALAATDVSAVLEVTNGQPIIVERAMYLDTPGQTFGAGHESAGVTAPATEWFLAEGATGTFFDLFVLLANPGATAAEVEATYLLPNGTTIKKTYDVAGNSRFNIWVDLEDTRLADTAVSTTIRSTNQVPIIVERALWWPGSFGQWYEAHNSPGATTTGSRWALAEGEVGGPRDTDTYILIANTSASPGAVLVTLLLEDGTTLARAFTVGANSRFNVQVRSEFPGAAGKRFGAIVESQGASPASIVVERAMYWDARGQTWAAGTNALATKLP